jgi:mono/diheme cytochrome c family protein
MNRVLRSGLACVAVIAMLAVAGGCSERMGKGWDWNRMRTQPRYEPYRSSSFFADGKAMQLPPAGTVSRESQSASARPVAIDDRVIARGESQFHIYCAVCHGERGDGASLVATNMEQPKPPSLIAPPVALMPANVIATVIASGMGAMPSFAAELSPADRQAVAAYVRTLQPAPARIGRTSTR